jgi:hypothetical protein
MSVDNDNCSFRLKGPHTIRKRIQYPNIFYIIIWETLVKFRFQSDQMIGKQQFEVIWLTNYFKFSQKAIQYWERCHIIL